MENFINAIRGTERRRFSLGTWQAMPLTKYGWKQAAEEPEVVTQLKLSKTTSEQDYADMILAARQSGDKEKLKEVLHAKAD